ALVLYHTLRAGSHPLTVDANLFRQSETAEERLGPGATVHPGDHLFLEVTAPEETYVYVLNEDEKGNVFVLFPAGLDLANPLPAGIHHRLPGRTEGQQMTWTVTNAGGTETFLVIASRRALEDVERTIARIPRAEQGRQIAYSQMNPEALQALRGIGGVA